MATGLERVGALMAQALPVRPLGRVAALRSGLVAVQGLSQTARLGDLVRLGPPAGGRRAEILRIDEDGRVWVLPDGPPEGLTLGAPVALLGAAALAPDDSWIGRVIDPYGDPLDERPLLPGGTPRPLRPAPMNPAGRRPLGPRLETGLSIFNTMLPLVQGQRLGLFAGSGVGKSSLLGQLAQGVAADVVVVALVGERGRELRDFVERVLGPAGMAKTVLVAATSDRSAAERRRCAHTAMTVAEHFRDAGRQVLLLVDSVTRLAEAHREIALAAGEPASLRGFPPSTMSVIAGLCERAGPGPRGAAADITAVFTVLVAGADMDEPVADMLRGVLDGHVVLDRAIAERGRFPAVDVLRSVSRALPHCASDAENTLIAEARALMGAYDRAEAMIQAGLYAAGSDPAIDRAIAAWPRLDAFVSRREDQDTRASFLALGACLARNARKRADRGGEG
ncbi:MAG: FliI/YscN family ATPase [Tranquillimonas sp.]